MKQLIVAVLFCLSVCLPSCKRGSSVVPAGGASVRIEDNGWGYCYGWKGDEILYVLFLRETQSTPAGPMRKGGTQHGTRNTVSDHRNLVLDGKDFALDYTSTNPDAINIAGVEYKLSMGRIFLCSVHNDAVAVKQVDVPVQRNRDYQQEMKRLAAEPLIRSFLF